MAEIVDAHIQQKGMVAMQVKDGEMFVFTETTLQFLLKQAQASPDKKAIVFIPVKRAN